MIDRLLEVPAKAGQAVRISSRLMAMTTVALTACWPSTSAISSRPVPTSEPVTAIVGATVIDGTGAPPRRDVTVVLEGRHIRAVGPQRTVRVPANAEVIDGRGLFVLPGFVDANIWGRPSDALQYGVTTVRGGDVEMKRWARDKLLPRLLARGSVVGWEGEETVVQSYRARPDPAGFGVAPDLMGLDIDSLRVRINQFLDTGVDYIKYGATAHVSGFISFSSRAQRVIVEEVHKRGLAVDAHATGVEGLRMAVLAGVDNIVHAEVNSETHGGTADRPWPDDLVQLLVERRVVCTLHPKLRQRSTFFGSAAWHRTLSVNRQKLIRAGCTIAVISDGWPGRGTLVAIENLVTEEGMTPMAAIVAATRNGALVCKMLDQFGTVTAGKFADLVVLRADPLQDIKHIEQTVMVFAEGRRLDVDLSRRDRNR